MTDTAATLFEIVDRLEAKGALGSGSRLSAMLRYLINEEQSGRGDRLKAFAIAQDVLGRGDDFDPQTNSIVRVEMARLRQALDLYFATAGIDEPIAIKIPKGGYRPVFVHRAESAPAAGPAGPSIQPSQENPPAASPGRSAPIPLVMLGVAAISILIGILGGVLWMGNRSKPGEMTAGLPPPANSIGVAPFTGAPGSAAESKALSRELAAKLAQSKSLLVVDLGDNAAVRAQDGAGVAAVRVQHIVSGEISESRGTGQVSITLTNAENRQLVWSRNYSSPGIADPQAFDQVASLILNDLRPQIHAAAKQVIQRRAGQKISPVELFLIATWFPGFAENSLSWEVERVELARRALSTDPKFGPAHSVLADKLAYLANVDPPSDKETASRAAHDHANLALALAPGDPDVLFNVALYYWHTGQTDNAERAMKRVVELDRANNLAAFMAEAIPFTCASVSADVLQRLAKLDESFGADNPVRWVTLGWIARLQLNRGETAEALDSARRANQIFEAPDTFLLAAAILVEFGKKEEAAALLSKQRVQWPNLDLRHYAEATMPRRCGAGDKTVELKRLYRNLADSSK